ncbi:hypothetical protein [Flavobacterium cyanobacteriorum]|uniref:hypothetical protein n=1 Tax=Flavobacterium cyanobacteriorum TaxID=2022802 RepID=UPI001A9C758E|nr:hypothetical protein [Flavobacterium cyanobacteriorum]
MGKLFVNTIYEIAKRNADKAIQLNVNRYNPAVHFYEATGFKIIKEEDIDIGQGYLMEDYVMQKEIA